MITALTFNGDLDEIGELAEGHGIAIHVDGRRVVLMGLTIEEMRALRGGFGTPIQIAVVPRLAGEGGA